MNVALLGTGLLGRAIATRLRATGHSVTVYNRTRANADPLRQIGVTVADCPVDAVRAAECAILTLADAQAIRQVLLSNSTRTVLAQRTVIQMGTIAPQESLALNERVRAAGGDYLEAPVLGSIAEAKAGALLVMVGGTEEQFARWSPLFCSLSREPRLIGPVGQAALMKLALNQLIAAEIAAFSLSLGLLQQSGVPVETFMTLLRESALFAPTFEKKLPRLLARDYSNPNFSTSHLLKDDDLCLRVSAEAGVEASSLAAVKPLLAKAIEEGFGELDYSAVYSVIAPPRQDERSR